MPVHRVALDDDLETTVAAIEHKETIVAAIPVGAGAAVVFTCKKLGRPAKTVETR